MLWGNPAHTHTDTGITSKLLTESPPSSAGTRTGDLLHRAALSLSLVITYPVLVPASFSLKMNINVSVASCPHSTYRHTSFSLTHVSASGSWQICLKAWGQVWIMSPVECLRGCALVLTGSWTHEGPQSLFTLRGDVKVSRKPYLYYLKSSAAWLLSIMRVKLEVQEGLSSEINSIDRIRCMTEDSF